MNMLKNMSTCNYLVEAVEITALETPEAIAVRAGDVVLTYRELADSSSLIAEKLKTHEAETVIICLDRSVNLICSILAALKINRAFSIIELGSLTSQQISNRLDQLEPQQIVTNRFNKELISQYSKWENIVAVEDAFECVNDLSVTNSQSDTNQSFERPDPHSTAYIVYTSGSTGKPKGVAISHDNISAYLEGVTERLDIIGSLNCLHVSSFDADLGNTSIFLALFSGGCLHVLTNEQRRDPRLFLGYLENHQVDLLKITPSHWSALFGGNKFQNPLKYLVFGGEKLNKNVAKTALTTAAKIVVNHYGPSETTIGVCAHLINNVAELDDIEGDTVPIGQLFSTCRGFLETKDGNQAPVSSSGKLCISGRQVSTGYTDVSVDINKAFILNSGTGERAYSTGDQVSADKDGVLLFLGRQDRQVKIRGYRVELDHIETIAMASPDVLQAGCIAEETGHTYRLICAVQPADDEFCTTKFKKYLETQLDQHMLPGKVVSLDTLPITGNGKIDYSSLTNLLLKLENASISSSQEGGDNQGEDLVRDLFSEILGHRDFSNKLSFFEAGGDSLGSIQLLCDLQSNGFEIGSEVFLKDATVDGVLKNSSVQETNTNELADITSTSVLSPSQNWFFCQKFDNQNAWNQSVLLDISANLSPELLHQAVAALSKNHPLLRSVFAEDGSIVKVQEASTNIILNISDFDSDEEMNEAILPCSKNDNDLINITTGSVFVARLFRSAAGKSKLYLVAHHLVVDMASWRCIFADLSRHYGEIQSFGNTRDIRETNSLLHWAGELDNYLNLPSPVHCAEFSNSAKNIEKDSRGVWYGLDSANSKKLRSRLTERYGSNWYGALLALFAKSIEASTSSYVVDLVTEGHGRLAIPNADQLFRSVGWYTSMSQFSLDSTSDNFVELVVGEFNEIERTAHIEEISPSKTSPESVSILFNFLGDIGVPGSGPLGLSFADDLTAELRGPTNDRLFDYKITGRISEGQLIFDISYNSANVSMAEAEGIVSHFHGTVADFVPELSDVKPTILLDHRPSNGALFHVPSEMRARQSNGAGTTLVTGATGYLGIHFLRHLIRETDNQVVCIVRERPNRTADESLIDFYSWYFPKSELEGCQDRLTVINGDLQSSNMGLPEEQYLDMANCVDKVAHFAADINLVGENSNLISTEEVVRFCQSGLSKELHYMSTLAVSGTVEAENFVEFSEQSLDIGQNFLNDYERSKFDCEKTVNEFFDGGGKGKIYRAGNVSGCAENGRFQRNAKNNRFVTLLSAICDLGMVPATTQDAICLTPVDDVSRAFFALFESSQFDRETLHIDNGFELEMAKFYDAINNFIGPLTSQEGASLEDLFNQFGSKNNAQHMLGKFWANRASRNVSFDHSSSTRKLKTLGFEYTPLGAVWIERFVTDLKQRKVLASSSSH